MKLIKNNNAYFNLISIAIGFILLIGFDVLIAKKTLPLTEGWWEVIAKASKNKDLYTDIYIGLPPLYINFIGFLQNFTENLFGLRVIFICMHILEVFTLAYVFSRFFNLTVSIVSAIISDLLITTYITTYLVKDYHLFLQLLINLYLISFFYFYKSRNFNSIFSLSLFSSAIILTKQNYGVLLLFANYLAFITIKDNLKNKIINTIKLTLCIFGLLFLYSYINGFYWVTSYLGNDSKGSIITILTRILSEKSTIQIIIGLLIFYAFNFLKTDKDLEFSKVPRIYFNEKYFYKIAKITIAMVSGYLALRIVSNKDFNAGIAVVYFYIIVGIIYYWGISKRHLNFIDLGILSIPILAILYGNTLTAGYNFSGFQVGIAVLFCILLSIVGEVSKNIRNLISIILLLVISINFYNLKYQGQSYVWWGYQLGSIEQAKYHLENKYLSGINLTEDTYAVVNRVSKLKSQNISNIYTYPNIPLFYYILDKEVKTKFPVTWFDVIPNKFTEDVISEFVRINPDYIFWLKPAKSTYDGHYKLKRSESVMSEFDRYISSLIEKGEYKLLWSRPMGLRDSNSRDIDSPIITLVECRQCGAIEFNKLIINNQINNVKIITPAKHIYEIEFSNGANYINFVENYNPIIINSKTPIFSIYIKVNQ